MITTKQAKPANNPADMDSLAGLLNIFKNNLFYNLRVCLPGIVASYNRSTKRANITPAIASKDTNGETLTLPQLSNVPVANLGGGGFSVSFPLQEGDTGWLIFTDRDISIYKNSRQISPSNTELSHDLNSAFFIPDTMQSVSIDAEDEGAATLQTLDGATKVSVGDGNVAIKATSIKLNGDVEVSGTLTAGTDVQVGSISLINHTHNCPTGGGTSSKPQ